MNNIIPLNPIQQLITTQDWEDLNSDQKNVLSYLLGFGSIDDFKKSKKKLKSTNFYCANYLHGGIFVGINRRGTYSWNIIEICDYTTNNYPDTVLYYKHLAELYSLGYNDGFKIKKEVLIDNNKYNEILRTITNLAYLKSSIFNKLTHSYTPTFIFVYNTTNTTHKNKIYANHINYNNNIKYEVNLANIKIILPKEYLK